MSSIANHAEASCLAQPVQPSLQIIIQPGVAPAGASPTPAARRGRADGLRRRLLLHGLRLLHALRRCHQLGIQVDANLSQHLQAGSMRERQGASWELSMVR